MQYTTLHYYLDFSTDPPTPRHCYDLVEWTKLFDTTKRHVAVTNRGNVRVSTIFLGIDHQWGDGPPLLFETMIFNGSHNGYQDRYSTWEEAVAGHKKALKLVSGKKRRKT